MIPISDEPLGRPYPDLHPERPHGSGLLTCSRCPLQSVSSLPGRLALCPYHWMAYTSGTEAADAAFPPRTVTARLDTLATQQDAQRRQPHFSFRALGVAMQCEASFRVWCVTFSLPDTDHTRVIWGGVQFEHRIAQALRLMQRAHDARTQHRLSTATNDIAGAPAHRIECACGWKGVWYAHLRALDRSRWRHLSTVELPIGGFIS